MSPKSPIFCRKYAGVERTPPCKEHYVKKEYKDGVQCCYKIPTRTKISQEKSSPKKVSSRKSLSPDDELDNALSIQDTRKKWKTIESLYKKYYDNKYYRAKIEHLLTNWKSYEGVSTLRKSSASSRTSSPSRTSSVASSSKSLSPKEEIDNALTIKDTRMKWRKLESLYTKYHNHKTQGPRLREIFEQASK